MAKIKLEELEGLDRVSLQSLGVYANLTEEFIEHLAFWLQSKTILDVMTGRGLLSTYLQETKYKVGTISTDNHTFESVKTGGWGEDDVEPTVQKLDAVSAVHQFANGINFLIISWPDRNDAAFKAIKRLYEINKHALVIFIGEKSQEEHRKMGDEQFFKHFEVIPSEDFHDIVVNHYDSMEFGDHPYLGRYSDNPNMTIDDYYSVSRSRIINKDVWSHYQNNNNTPSLLPDPQKANLDKLYKQLGLEPYSDNGELPGEIDDKTEPYEED